MVDHNGNFVARRAEIYEAAAQLFHERGFDGTSVQDIAERVGLLKGSLYHYFGSKEQLLFDLLHEDHETSLADLLTSAAEAAEDPEAQLRAAVVSAAMSAAVRPWRPATFVHEHRYLVQDHARAIMQIRRAYERCFVDILKDGKRKGVFRRDMDPELVAIAALSLVNAIATWYQPGRKWSAQSLAESYADLVHASVRA